MKAIFALFGIPEKVVSDNGSPLAGAEFSLFSEEWEFHHVTANPSYPKENGLVERFVQTAKHLLKKAKTGSHPPYLSLLEYRNTQIDRLPHHHSSWWAEDYGQLL